MKALQGPQPSSSVFAIPFTSLSPLLGTSIHTYNGSLRFVSMPRRRYVMCVLQLMLMTSLRLTLEQFITPAGRP